MRGKKNRKEGFALVFTVIALAIIIGVFLNYAMSARARKVIIQRDKGTANLDESLSQSIGLGIADIYAMDRIIVGKNDSVYNQLGYFIVKDIPQNKVSQDEAIKVWETIGNGNSGGWYSVDKKNNGGVKHTDKNGDDFYLGGTWSFTKNTLGSNVNASKGGYVIKRISSIEGGNRVKIYDGGSYNYKGSSNPIQERLEGYWRTNKTQYPKFEIELYKNMLYTLNPNLSGKNVRAYDALVKIELNYFPMEKVPSEDITGNPTSFKGIQSRFPIRMNNPNETGNIKVELPGVPSNVTTEIIAYSSLIQNSPPSETESVRTEEVITGDYTITIRKVNDNSNKNDIDALCSKPEFDPTPSERKPIGTPYEETKIFPYVSSSDVNPNNGECLYDEEKNIYVCEIGGNTIFGTTEGQETKITSSTVNGEIKIVEETPIAKGEIKSTISEYNVTSKTCTIGGEPSIDSPIKNHYYAWEAPIKYNEMEVVSKETSVVMGKVRVTKIMEEANSVLIPATATSKIKSYEINHIGP